MLKYQNSKYRKIKNQKYHYKNLCIYYLGVSLDTLIWGIFKD